MIRCPNCKYTPKRSDDSSDWTVWDFLEFFEVLGCDDGNIMCPRCGFEFGFRTSEHERKQQRVLF